MSKGMSITFICIIHFISCSTTNAYMMDTYYTVLANKAVVSYHISQLTVHSKRECARQCQIENGCKHAKLHGTTCILMAYDQSMQPFSLVHEQDVIYISK